MTDLPTRERRPARGGVASRKHSHKEAAERLRSCHIRSRSPVLTEINVAGLSRACDEFISALLRSRTLSAARTKSQRLPQRVALSRCVARGPQGLATNSLSATTTWRRT
jgi:hypothetical protein